MNAETSKAIPPKALRAKISEAYASCSRDVLEEKWIVDNLSLVNHVVGKVVSQLSRNTDTEDLIAADMLGLVKAARAFDPAKDAAFRTYAYIRIRGAIIDELRARSFLPPALHKQIRLVRQAYQSYLGANGCPPSDEELAGRLGISQGQLYRTLQEARRQNFLSIHGLAEDQPVLGALIPVDREPSPDGQVERDETLQRLTQAIAELPDRDRMVVLLYYERDLTMKETAEVLGLSESRVSQLHAGALFKLSMKLGPGRAAANSREPS